MQAFEYATNSSTNQLAFKRTGLVINAAVTLLLPMVQREELRAVIAESQRLEGVSSTGDYSSPGSGSDDGQFQMYESLNSKLFDNLEMVSVWYIGGMHTRMAGATWKQ
jgi:hypothetical protein